MSEPKIPIAAIRRLTIHDGPGVRDTVFVKGCSLHCLWCHNPECISARPQLLFHAKLCTACGACVRACPHGVHRFDDAGRHIVDRKNCTLCGQCVRACLYNALELCGEAMSVEEVFAKVAKDRDFFLPEGGVTLSGGEPALYPEFAAALFRKLRAAAIHTALDTAGAVAWEHYQTILPVTDLVLFDLKGMDPERHKLHTGMDNRLIHENLRKIGESGTPVEIRMPVVPTCSDFPDDAERTGRLLAELGTLVRVRLLAYHSLAGEKYAAAGMTDTLPRVPSPDTEKLSGIARVLRAFLPPEIPVSF